MNRFLRDIDYLRCIKQEHLNEITGGDMTQAYQIEVQAQLEMLGYLRERYYEDQLFSPTTDFDINQIYYGKNLINYTEAEFDISLTYSVNDRVSFNDKIYINIATSSNIPPSDTDNWSYLVDDNTLFYAKLPYPEWNMDKQYLQNDKVWYYDNDSLIGGVYNAISSNRRALPVQMLTPEQKNGSLNNNFQLGYSDKEFSQDYYYGYQNSQNTAWEFVNAYTFSSVYPIGSTNSLIYWQMGDNRDQQLVTYLVDISLYHLYSSASPRNIPELRLIRYDGHGINRSNSAIGWLEKVASGRVSTTLPPIVPIQGSSIMGHSPRVRRNNTW